MKKLLILLLLLLMTTAAFCKDKKTPKPFPRSRWKEISRMKPDSSIVAFTDTLFISFRAKDTFSYHYKNGFIYNGAYIFNEDSILDFGTASFRVLLSKPTKLVLINDAGIYQFAPDSSDTVKAIYIPKEEKIIPVTDIDQMIGHWTVYKKTSDNHNDVPDVGFQVRSAYITGASTDGKLGYIYGGNDADNDPSWYIKSFGTDQSLECDGKKLRIFKIVKCQNGEMILEEDGMKYYFKQFK